MIDKKKKLYKLLVENQITNNRLLVMLHKSKYNNKFTVQEIEYIGIER